MTGQKKIPRLPVKGALVISKADAAERQLTTAIWLWFHNFDPVPVHALACASLKILWKLHEKHHTGHKTMREGLIERVREEYRTSFIETLNETENFIKHADRDPMAFHSFNPENTELIVLDAVAALQVFNGRYPLECQAFSAWFSIHHYDLLLPETPYAKVVGAARQYSAETPRQEFFKLFAQALEVGRTQAAADLQRMKSEDS